jgi:hypothetical protein
MHCTVVYVHNSYIWTHIHITDTHTCIHTCIHAYIQVIHIALHIYLHTYALIIQYICMHTLTDHTLSAVCIWLHTCPSTQTCFRHVHMCMLIVYSLQPAVSSVDLSWEPLWSSSVTLISMARLLVGQCHQKEWTGSLVHSGCGWLENSIVKTPASVFGISSASRTRHSGLHFLPRLGNGSSCH